MHSAQLVHQGFCWTGLDWARCQAPSIENESNHKLLNYFLTEIRLCTKRGIMKEKKGLGSVRRKKLNMHTMRSYESLPLLIKNKADDGGRRAGKRIVLGQ